MMDKAELFEIDINKKYVMSFDRPIPDAEKANIKVLVAKWLKSDQPFLMLFGCSVKLVKIDEPEEAK